MPRQYEREKYGPCPWHIHLRWLKNIDSSVVHTSWNASKLLNWLLHNPASIPVTYPDLSMTFFPFTQLSMFFNILENSQILYPWPFRAYPHCGRCQWLSARKLSSQKSSPQCLYYISEKLNFVFSWTKCQYKSLHFTQKNCIPKIIYTLFSNLWEKIFIGVTVIKAFIAHLFFSLVFWFHLSFARNSKLLRLDGLLAITLAQDSRTHSGWAAPKH